MSQDKAASGEPIIIKKYANRRLYNTRSSSYITLDHLATMIKEDSEFKVVDAKSGEDITHTILTQIIMDEESSGEKMLPTSFLRQLIGLYGNSMQALVPSYLEASMDQFRNNQVKLRKTLEEKLGNNPVAQLAQRNMDMFKSAANAFRPGRKGDAKGGEGKGGEAKGAEASDKPAKADKPGRGETTEKDEIALLRAELAELQKKIDGLSK